MNKRYRVGDRVKLAPELGGREAVVDHVFSYGGEGGFPLYLISIGTPGVRFAVDEPALRPVGIPPDPQEHPMTCTDIRTQAELDAALADDATDCLHIRSDRGVWLTISDNRGKTVWACDSAKVWASGSATVWACDSATVRAYDSATVRAHGIALGRR